MELRVALFGRSGPGQAAVCGECLPFTPFLNRMVRPEVALA